LEPRGEPCEESRKSMYSSSWKVHSSSTEAGFGSTTLLSVLISIEIYVMSLSRLYARIKEWIREDSN